MGYLSSMRSAVLCPRLGALPPRGQPWAACEQRAEPCSNPSINPPPQTKKNTQVRRGSPAAEQWLIFSREGGGGGGSWAQVGRQARRPTGDQLELALYNAAVANSPITAGAKMLRGLADRVTGGGGGLK